MLLKAMLWDFRGHPIGVRHGLYDRGVPGKDADSFRLRYGGSSGGHEQLSVIEVTGQQFAKPDHSFRL